MRTYLLSILDRAGRTAIQTAAGLLAATRATGDWRTIAISIALATVVSVLQSVTDFPAIPGGLLGDVVGRALRTFAQTAVGSIGASVLITDVPWSTVLTAAALAAAASVLTSGITTNIGPVKGTPDLVAATPYVGHVGTSRHLRISRHATTGIASGVAAAVVFAGIATVGVASARDAPVRIIPVSTPITTSSTPMPTPTPTLTAPPQSLPDKSPAFFAALNRDGINTASDHAPLLLIARSVCGARGTTTDAQQTDQIVAAFPGKWNHAQAALIVDAAIDQYC